MSFEHLDEDEKTLARKLAFAFCQTLQDGYIRDKRGPCASHFHDACAQLVRRARAPQTPTTFMEKPSWLDAPQWARWLTFEADGHWLWFSHKPLALVLKWSKPDRASGGMHLYLDAWEDERLCRKSWRHFLEERPEI